MDSTANEFPLGNSAHTIRTTKELGHIVRLQRQDMKLRQLDVAGLANTGNRLIVDIENASRQSNSRRSLTCWTSSAWK